MDKLKKLLKKGYFPVQLPPGFTSETFAANYKSFAGRWNAQKTPHTKPEKFSVARSSYYRRVTSILNPIGFYFLAKEIDTYWQKIEKHYRQSKISLSIPKISSSSSLRAIELTEFSELYEAKVINSSGYRYVLITDISGFFPNIYTHAIPWAIHGKVTAKNNKSVSPEYFGNIFDQKCMGVQENQTIGLPIGPDTSHIIAEIIAVAIDLQLKEGLKKWPHGFRYVDDYFFFFDTKDEAEKCLAELTKSISNYELQINPRKTKIIEVKELVEESWKYNLKKIDISESKESQRNDLHNYFEVLFSLEKKFADESLIKYGLKLISSKIIKKSNWSVFEAYLLKCGFSFPNCLQVIANVFATYNYYKYDINTSAIERFCNNLIKVHAISDHHSEVSWLLWICKELSLNLKREVIREIESMSSTVCILIVLDLFNSGQIKHNIRVNYLRQYSNSQSLYDANWLLAYEAGRRKWLNNTDTEYISKDYFFGALLKNNVSFYDESKRCRPIFELKKEDDIDLDFLLDSDEHIEQHFEFDEMNEEYFDSNFRQKNINEDCSDINHEQMALDIPF